MIALKLKSDEDPTLQVGQTDWYTDRETNRQRDRQFDYLWHGIKNEMIALK